MILVPVKQFFSFMKFTNQCKLFQNLLKPFTFNLNSIYRTPIYASKICLYQLSQMSSFLELQFQKLNETKKSIPKMDAMSSGPWGPSVSSVPSIDTNYSTVQNNRIYSGDFFHNKFYCELTWCEFILCFKLLCYQN